MFAIGLVTTITALIAAFNRTEAALTIALVHLLINMIGVLIFLPFPVIRKIPVYIAYRFGAWTFDSRVVGFSYILFTFFLLPFTLIYINRDSVDSQRYEYVIEEPDHGATTRIVVVNHDKVKENSQVLVYNASEDDEKDIPNIDRIDLFTCGMYQKGRKGKIDLAHQSARKNEPDPQPTSTH